jgi:hypothetical protein
VKLWAVCSDQHSEIDVGGDREGLQALAHALRQTNPLELVLDAPPKKWQGETHALRFVRLRPVQSEDARICFERDDAALVVSGKQEELARIVAEAVAEVAEGPAKKNGVGSHAHLDPTSDPERRYYAGDSGSLVVAFDDGE